MDIATIGFEADTSGLERAERRLDAIPPKAAAAERAAKSWGSAAVISGQQVSKAMVGAAAGIEGLSVASTTATSTMGALATVLSGPVLLAVTALVSAIVVLTGGLTLFIHNTIEAEKVQAQLESTLKSTGAAAGQTADSLDRHAQALQAVTTFEDDTIKSAQTLLLTFTRVQGEVFPRATEAALDMATVLKMDLSSAMIQVGKLLDNPTRGMNLLRRAGIELGASQKQLIKDFMASGQVVKAQEVILAVLESRFKGSAEAARNTLGGALIALKNTFGNLFELTGDQASPLTDAINELNKAISQPEFKEFLELIGVNLFRALGLLAHAVNRAVQGFNLLVEGVKIAIGWLSELASWFAKQWDWDKVFGEPMLTTIENTVNKAIGFLVSMYIEAKSNFENLPDVIAAAMIGAINNVIRIFNSFLTFFTEKLDWLIGKANALADSVPGLGGLKINPIGQAGQIPTLANPAADRLNQGGDFFALSINDQKKFDQQAAMNKKWLDSIKGAATEAKKEVKAAGGAVRDFGDDLDSSGGKAEDAFKKIVSGAEATIAKLKLETETLGMNVGEVARLKTEQELLQKAKEADLKLTDQQISKLKELASATGDVTNANEAAKGTFKELEGAKEFIAQQKLAQDQLGLSAEAAARLKYETELLNKASQNGAVILKEEQIGALKSAAAEMAAMETQTKEMTEAISFVKDIFSDLFSDLKDALISGKNLWDAFGDAALGVLSKIADKLLNMALDGLMGSILGGGTSSSGSTGFLGRVGSGLGDMLQQTGNFFGIGGDNMGRAGLPGSSFFGPVAPGAGGSWMSQMGLGNWLGVAGGLASGAMGLSKGGTAGTIGGIAGLLGAGVSLIPGIGQIAGPVIGLLGGLLPGLFESKPEPPTMRGIGSIDFSRGGFRTSGAGYNGGSAIDLSGLGGQVDSLLRSAKVAVDRLTGEYGIQQQSFSKGDFSNQTTFIRGANGQMMQWGQSSDPAQQQQAMDTAAAHIAHQMMLEVDSGISDIMREGLSNFGLKNLQHAFSSEELGVAVQKLDTLSEAFKNFGKDISDGESAIRQVDEAFDELFNTAAEFGISASEVAKIEQERNRQRLKATEDFTRGISQEILGFTDPMQGSINDLEKWYSEARKNNEDFLRLVPGYLDQAQSLEQLYYLKRNQIIEQANAEALAEQQRLIDQQKNLFQSLSEFMKSLLPGGAMAGEGLLDQLTGLTGTYNAARAQAMASPLDDAKVQEFIRSGAELLEFQKSFFAGDERYQEARVKALQDAQSVQDAVAKAMAEADAKAAAIPGGQRDPEVAEMIAKQNQLSAQIAELMESQARLNAQLRRRAAQGG